MKQLIFSFLILLSLTAKAQGLKPIADSIRENYEIPELAYAVVSRDSIMEMNVTGYHRTDMQNETTIANKNDYFHLGSNTKAITGFIAAWLVESGKIHWDTRFFDLFPSWKKESNPAYDNITLQDLLSHRAGIEPYMNGIEFNELPEFKGNVQEQREAFARYVLKEKPVGNDGAAYHYSNAGYNIAALMLEKVSGKSWEELVNEVLAQKLHLHYKLGWPNKGDPNQPWGHWMENDSLKALSPAYPYKLYLTEPAGDISMPLPDYAKFIQMNLQGLAGRDTFLKAPTYRFLHFGFKEYSIGWGNSIQKQLSEHAGSAGTFYCYTLIDAQKGTAYIIMANSAAPKAQEGIFKLLGKMRERW